MTKPNTILDDPPLTLDPSPGSSIYAATTSDPILQTLDPDDRRYWPISLSHREVKTLRRALKRQRRESLKEQQRNQRTGWQPEPGRENVVDHMLQTIDDLLDRLPHPGFEGKGDK